MKKLCKIVLVLGVIQGCGKVDDENEESSKLNAAIVGTWTACLKEFDGQGVARTSVRTTFTFSEDLSLKVNSVYYLDTVCTEPDEGEIYETLGRYATGVELDSGITPITLIYTGVNEDGSDIDFFQIFKVEGDRILFGKDTDEYDASTEEKRPQVLDILTPYSKVQ